MIPTLKKLNKTALSLLEVLDLESLYEVIVREGLRLVNARYGTIYLGEKGVLQREFTTVPNLLQVQVRKDGFTQRAYKSKKIVFVKTEKVEKVHHKIKDFEVKSIVLIPLCYRNKCIGVISLDSYKDSLSEEEISTLNLFGSMATLAIKQALLHKETQMAVEQRDLMISLTAHEFRTPLTTINGYAQLLQRKLKTDNESVVAYVNELHSETKRLIDLTNGLLDMSRIKTGKMVFSFEECFLDEILDKAITRFRFAFPNHILIFKNEVKEKAPIIGDFDKILQVFTNFLDNAGKFSPPSEAIFLTLKSKNKWWVISITDKGRGIAEDDVSRIFTGFYKAKNSDETQGMGLGLFIAKSIIDAHQGRVHVHSQLNVGTSFEIMLPNNTYATI